MNHDKVVFITGMSFTNIQKEEDYWGDYHVNREDILFFKPEADISTANKFFIEALNYINNSTDFVSTEEAKMDIFYSA